MEASTLLSPVIVGPYLLRNRLVMPPLTRCRADKKGAPTDLMTIHYAQRSTAGLIITEGTTISPQGGGYPGVPGIYNAEQVDAWRRVTVAVHARGGHIFLQLWHVGRQTHSSVLPGRELPVAPSAVPIVNFEHYTGAGMVPYEVPRALELDEIPAVVAEYAQAARNAMLAGFDGVEIHGANGYLIDQFLNDRVNLRTDEYGGSLKNRVRFLREVCEAVSGACGAERVGIRLSPSSTWMDALDSDKRSLFTEAVSTLAGMHLAYLHLIEPTIAGSQTVEAANDGIPSSFFRSLYPGTLIVSGDHTARTGAAALAEGTADLIGFGRLFIANPDLPERFRLGAPLNDAKPDLFYTPGAKGYTDYPALADEARLQQLTAEIDAHRISESAALAAMERRDPIAQVDSGDYYARLKLAAI